MLPENCATNSHSDRFILIFDLQTKAVQQAMDSKEFENAVKLRGRWAISLFIL